MAESEPVILSRAPLDQGNFIELESILWRGADGVERVWEAAERVGRCEAVMMIPWLRPSNRLVLIRQYRPPVDGFIIEFPAGIIDHAGESPESTALREMVEETGYHGVVKRVIPPTFNTPGLTSESVYQVTIEVDENLAENRTPIAALDDGEHITVITVPAADLTAFLQERIEAGERFDSKVAAYLQAWSSREYR